MNWITSVTSYTIFSLIFVGKKQECSFCTLCTQDNSLSLNLKPVLTMSTPS